MIYCILGVDVVLVYWFGVWLGMSISVGCWLEFVDLCLLLGGWKMWLLLFWYVGWLGYC